jgi:DNA-binding response OmpR family regulator
MSKSKSKILIVDDAEDLCEILQFNLEGEGYSTEVAYSAEEALKKDLGDFDLILLDVMMEKMSGFHLAEKIRKEKSLNVPIIFITAKNTENDLLTGFSLGGDDFITKPFSIKEVIVRIKAVLKRMPVKIINENKEIRFRDLVLNTKKHSITIKDKKIKLTKKEFDILSLLLKNEGVILSRNDILGKVWDESTIVTDRTVDVHITRLRKKIGHYGKFLKGKSGFGYTFES